MLGMDEIDNRYRNIIERAAFMGLITEETKPYYLSSIQENASDLSELDSCLNKEETNTKSRKKMKKSNIIKIINDVTNTIDEEIQMRALNNHSSLSNLSGGSIENYDILDISNCEIKSDATGTETDDSSARPNNVSNSKHLAQSSKVMAQVIKKPRRNQIIDFNIPVYTSTIKKKSSVKPYATYSHKAVQCEVSGTKCKPTDINSKQDRKEKPLSPKKWSISKSKNSLVDVKRSTASRLKNIYENTNTPINQSNEPIAEANTTALQKTDELKEKQLLYTYPSQKEDSEDLFDENSTVSLQESDWDKSVHLFTNKNTTQNTHRKLKFRTDLVNQEYTIRLKPRMVLDAPRCIPDIKTTSKKRTVTAKNTEKCIQRRYKSKQQVLNCDSTTDTINGEGISARDVPQGKSVPADDCDRFLNLNIICQFYEDEARNNHGGIQLPQSSNGTSTEPKEIMKNKEAPEEPSTEMEKTKPISAIQRLSKFFTNRSTKKK